MDEPRGVSFLGYDSLFTSSASPPRPGWFVSLIDLMGHGPGAEDRLRGVVHARVEDDGGREFSYRVERRGPLVRCSSLNGAVHVIAGSRSLWIRRDREPSTVEELPFQGHIYAPDDYQFGLQRPGPERWRGTDFTTPTGPPQDTIFLGRPALLVELAPPRHKPHPMQLTVDRETGLILRQSNRAFGTFAEWIELDTGAELPHELFTWQPHDRPANRYE